MRLDFVREKMGAYACWDYDSQLQLILSDIKDTPYGPYALVEAGHRDLSLRFPPMRIGLQDIRSQREWLREITDLDGKLPWPIALREFCLWVLRERGAVERADLLHPRPEPSDAYLISPLFPLEERTVLFGDGGIGKSHFALGVCLTYMTGHPVIPGLGFQKPGIALYIDFERSRRKTEIQLGRLMRGAEMPESDTVHYLRLNRPLPTLIDEIRREIDRTKADFLMIDSQGFASGGEIERAESTLRFYADVASLGLTTGITAHVPIALRSETGERRPYGSIHGRNAVDMAWDLRQTDEVTDPGEDYAYTLVFRHNKPGADRRHPPLAFRVRFPPQCIVYLPTDVPEDDSRSGGGQRAEIMTILMSLPIQAWTYQELARDTGIPLASVSKVCRRLKDNKKVTLQTEGKAVFVKLAPLTPKEAP